MNKTTLTLALLLVLTTPRLARAQVVSTDAVMSDQGPVNQDAWDHQSATAAPAMALPIPPPEQKAPAPPKPKKPGKSKAERAKEARAAALAKQLKADRLAGLSALRKGTLGVAEADVKKLVEESPESADGRLTFAVIELLSGRPELWKVEAARAQKLNPKMKQMPPSFLCEKLPSKSAGPVDPCVTLSKGVVRQAFGDKGGALKDYAVAIAAAPKLWLGFAFRGILKVQTGSCEGGKSDLRRAAALDPAYASPARYYLDQCPTDAVPEPPPPEPSIE